MRYEGVNGQAGVILAGKLEQATRKAVGDRVLDTGYMPDAHVEAA